MIKIFGLLTMLAVFISPAQAAVVGFANNSLWFSAPTMTIEGASIKIYTNIVNGDLGRFEGDLTFYANNEIIGSPIHFNISPDESRLFSTTWLARTGDYKFSARINNDAIFNDKNEAQAIAINRFLSSNQELLFVDNDSDKDGLGDKAEITGGTDPKLADSDGDGYNDLEDQSPLNKNIFPGPDTDGDGISDKVDTDIDNDGLYNWEELELGTNPLKRDTDDDGLSDQEDAHPLDSKRWLKEEIKILTEASQAPASNQISKDSDVSLRRKEVNISENKKPLNPSVVPIVSHVADSLEKSQSDQSNIQQYSKITTNATPNVIEPVILDFDNNNHKISIIVKQLFNKNSSINNLNIKNLMANPLIAIPLVLLVICLIAVFIFYILWLNAKKNDNY